MAWVLRMLYTLGMCNTKTSQEAARMRRAVRQQAQAAKLMGVDFVPCFRTGDGIDQALGDGPCELPEDDRRAKATGAMKRLRAKYERQAPHQHFNTSFTNIVWGDGDVCARLMFIGEAPGADEDRTGVPFVGRAGQLLNKMILAMGLRREMVYIANVLKTRPPNNATPTLEEADACAPYLYKQIEIVKPEVIVTLGLPAARLILQSNESMGRMRGQWARFSPPGSTLDPIAVMPTYHPAYLLRAYTAENRKKVWSDLKMAMDRLGLEKPSA